jgi:hypothetical protein
MTRLLPGAGGHPSARRAIRDATCRSLAFVALNASVGDVERLGLHRQRILVGDVGVEACGQGCEQAGEHEAVIHEFSFAG